MKKKYYIFLVLTAICIFLSCTPENQTPHTPSVSEEVVSDLSPIYYTDSISNIDNQTTIKDSYIRDRFTGMNHFYIDDENVLWGTGNNDYWQLGIAEENDRNNLGSNYSSPIKIAEDVIHVDSSSNGYFVIYLTEDNELYGLGANTNGVLRLPVQMYEDLNLHDNITASPVLLMDDVLFASAGRKSLSVLTKDEKVWWWGIFASTTATNKIGSMYSKEPICMLENARYTICGGDFAAAIDKNNNLWTWGNNVWGQCGAKPSVDYIKEATKVSGQVAMVWPELPSSKQNTIPFHKQDDYNPYHDITYSYTIFIRKEDGNTYACGIDLGTEEKSVDMFGDISYEDSIINEFDTTDIDFSHQYSWEFIPITFVEKQIN